MAEVAPAAPVSAAPASKAPARRAAGAAKSRKPLGPSVTELLMQAVTASKERGGISLAALKKSLAAFGYDVEKNNSRIKLGLKSLVTKGALLQTKGTGASGSFKLNRKQAETKDKAPGAAAKRKPQAAAAAKSSGKKPAGAAKRGKKPSGAAAAKKGPKKGLKRAAAKSPRKPKAAAKAKKAAKSPAKARAAKPKAKPKTPKAKVAKPKKASLKK